MHTITVTFEDKEFEELQRVKNEVAKLNWHDFILGARTYFEPYADGM